MYAIQYPDGKIDQEYISPYKKDLWENHGFWFMCHIYGEEWRTKFWKRLEASKKDFKEKGYKIVKVKVVAVKEK